MKNSKVLQIIDKLNSAIKIDEFYFASMGGGIRGSLLSTIYLILLTLVISLPLGILVALYLGNYAKDNKFIQILRTLIDMISGIPSIIFGLVGVIVFIPFVSVISNTSGLSILAGAFTMSIMILPLIIKNTEDAIVAVYQWADIFGVGYENDDLFFTAKELISANIDFVDWKQLKDDVFNVLSYAYVLSDNTERDEIVKNAEQLFDEINVEDNLIMRIVKNR